MELQHIVLLTPEAELAERLATKDLSDFMKLSTRVIGDYFAELAPGTPQQLVAEFRIQLGGTVGARLVAEPGLPDPILRSLRRELLDLVGPTVRGAPVAYQMFFLIWSHPVAEG